MLKFFGCISYQISTLDAGFVFFPSFFLFAEDKILSAGRRHANPYGSFLFSLISLAVVMLCLGELGRES